MSTARLTTPDADRSLRARAIALVEQFHWLHTSLGLVGNISFFVGSVFFLFESLKTAGVWLFIIGSLGMMLGSIGDKVTQLEDEGGSSAASGPDVGV